MSASTRQAFDVYADGVNAYLATTTRLPPEYEEAGATPEPWEAWHSVAVHRIRHVFMGTWQLKLAQAQLLAAIGPDVYSKLNSRAPRGTPVMAPPDAATTRLVARATDELRDAASELAWLRVPAVGSNAWAVAGSRTATGHPILCNDPHRELEFPNVYWQARVRCPEFDVVGATFPGLPGFPNFGHNGHVAWSVTHAMADYQDLYIEKFDQKDPRRYKVPGGWALANIQPEVMRVKGGPDISFETWTTRHGPIVHGDPRLGPAIALSYTGLNGSGRTFEVLGPMLQARTVSDLMESQREWVDPVNNLVCADVSGNIGYLLRGVLPIRSSDRHRQFPTRGWTGESEWVGHVEFDDMPQILNPPDGFIVSANQPILPTGEPYIADSFVEPYRAERIVELLTNIQSIEIAQAGAMQSDTTSTAARRWVHFLRRQSSLDGPAELARALISSWDANLTGDSAAALLYGYFRRRVARVIFEPLIGNKTWAWLAFGREPALESILARWLANVVSGLDAGASPPNGSSWSATLQQSLGSAWLDAVSIAGDDPARWRWADAHRLKVPLAQDSSPVEPDILSGESSLGIGGDGDTINVASYYIGDQGAFDVVLVAVYRQVVDLSRSVSATYAIPGGASGDPRTEHYLDQLPLWARCERVPTTNPGGTAIPASETILKPDG